MVSIIVPAYNRADLIERCIGSALSQSVSDLEVIIVDDGSTDSTGRLCDTMAASEGRIRVLHQTNGGVSAARQAGIDMAAGEWICFLDSDDTLPPDALEKYSEAFPERPDIIVSGCARQLDPKSFVLGISNYSLCPTLWGKLFRTDFIKGNMPAMPRELVMGEDLAANLVLGIKAEKIRTVGDLLYNVTLDNGQSVMNTFRHSFQYENFFFQTMNDMLPEESASLPYYNELAGNLLLLKMNGYRNVVLDGASIDTGSKEWTSFVSDIRRSGLHLGIRDRFFLMMQHSQGLYRLIMNTYLKLRK